MTLANELLAWYDGHIRPFLERHALDRLPALDNERARLAQLLQRSSDVTICFLGNANVGKSTLLNALAAGDRQVLPAGGIGPLTAQATEVRFSDIPSFEVEYHPRERLWRLAFILESRLERMHKDATVTAAADIVEQLGASETQDALRELAETGTPEPDTSAEERFEQYTKQARQLVTGDQFSNMPLEYLADALRAACGFKPRWGHSVSDADRPRIERLFAILNPATDVRQYRRTQTDDSRTFGAELRDHAAGFLSPLIRRIEVRWPSDLLRQGVVLVDLPGIGIAQDTYREITKRYIRDRARAVILVVDRAGLTDSTIDLLRTSGYWDRVVSASDDPTSDPCTMMIAVTKVDEIALEDWARIRDEGGAPPKKHDIFARLADDFRTRMLAQVQEQLGRIAPSNNDAVNEARAIAKREIVGSLEVHPVCAPEYRRILRSDEDDRPLITSDKDVTGIPGLRKSLVTLARSQRAALDQSIREVSERLRRSATAELRIIDSLWRDRGNAAEEVERLRKALDGMLAPKRKEYDRRVGAFREYLEATVETRIRELVLEARAVAEAEVNTYLYELRHEHWAALRAAVVRGGTWLHGRGRAINLPDDIATYFQEPMAAVWSQRLLKDIRNRTGEFARTIAELVAEECRWASEHASAHVDQAVLDEQTQRIADQAAQLRQVGKEAVDELRNVVKQKLMDVIKKPIVRQCEKFVEAGDHKNRGVKDRILTLFAELARGATQAAEKPARAVLERNFEKVREEIRATFDEWKDPLESTAELILQRQESRVKRSDGQKRTRVLAEIEHAIDAAPADLSTIASGDAPALS